ncbi:MAG: dual specificity protein phosphatase family protein [Candidatus Saccharicenans sp.]|jgi:protein tyrosine/serine phosphatase|nr:dual specificity protein phosphatase family protein [Candidatus Saccharicenans sp.]
MTGSSQLKQNKLRLSLILLLAVSCLLANSPACQKKAPRPEHWAKPIKLQGVPNFYQVSDLLYRSAQPTAEGFKELEKFGIRSVIDLRGGKTDQKSMAGTNLKYFAIPSKASQVREEDLVKFLKIVTDPADGPYLVHCHYGADRTGLFIAVYRIVIDNWPKEEAIHEMQSGGFGFNNTYANIIKYLQGLDPEKIRQALK